MTRDEALRRAETFGNQHVGPDTWSALANSALANLMIAAYNEGRDAQARETITIIRETEPKWDNDQYTPADYVRDQIRDAVRRARPSAFADPTGA